MPESEQTLLFAETGLATIIDDVDRVALTDGSLFIAEKIEIRPSRNYGEYAVIDGQDFQEQEFHAYTTSGVILSQAKALLEKFGDREGHLTPPITCSVVAKISSSSGHRFLMVASIFFFFFLLPSCSPLTPSFAAWADGGRRRPGGPGGQGVGEG